MSSRRRQKGRNKQAPKASTAYRRFEGPPILVLDDGNEAAKLATLTALGRFPECDCRAKPQVIKHPDGVEEVAFVHTRNCASTHKRMGGR